MTDRSGLYTWLLSPLAQSIFQWLQLGLLALLVIGLLLALRYVTWTRYTITLRTRLHLFRTRTSAPDYFDRLMRAQRLVKQAEARQRLLVNYPQLAASLALDVAEARQHLARIQHPRRLR